MQISFSISNSFWYFIKTCFFDHRIERPPALRPAGSDPRVGDGLVWNPVPMAIKYIFLDRMQRS